jgi:hypothetical protein
MAIVSNVNSDWFHVVNIDLYGKYIEICVCETLIAQSFATSLTAESLSKNKNESRIFLKERNDPSCTH